MNVPQQDQVPSGQSSAQAPTGPITASDAARILASRRTELRQEAATQARPEAIPQAPAEETLDEQLSGDSVEGDGQQVATGTDDVDNPDSQSEQPADGEESAIEAVLLDGEEIPLSQIKDWREGAMRQEDYTRKTQVLVQQKESISAMEARINSFAHAMNRQFMAEQQEQSEGLQKYQRIDWVKLAQQDPAKYNAAKAAFDAEQTRFQQKQAQWQGFLQEFDRVNQESLALRAQAALPEIKSRIKGWSDAKYAELSDFAVQTYGYDRGMLNKITDPQFWETMNDAATYRKGSKVKTVPAKVTRTPKVTTRTTAGVSQKAVQSQQQQNTMKEALNLTGSSQMEAAAEALRARRSPR